MIGPIKYDLLSISFSILKLFILTWNGITPHLCEGMALYRCECKPSKALLPRRHLYLFSWTPFSTTDFTDTYSCMPGGSYKTQVAYLIWCL